jgi:hypothetical protein
MLSSRRTSAAGLRDQRSLTIVASLIIPKSGNYQRTKITTFFFPLGCQTGPYSAPHQLVKARRRGNWVMYLCHGRKAAVCNKKKTIKIKIMEQCLDSGEGFSVLISVLKRRTSDVVPPFESGPEATGLAAISGNPALAPQISASNVSGAYNHDFKHSVASMKSSPHRRSGRRIRQRNYGRSRGCSIGKNSIYGE